MEMARLTIRDVEAGYAIDGLVLAQREQVLMSIKESGEEWPVPVDPYYEWDADEVDETDDLVYMDDLSGKVLDPKLVVPARSEEVEFIDTIGLWDAVPRPRDQRVIGTRWVDVNKGDVSSPDVRSRLVAKEIKGKNSLEQYFAAMPPLSSLKLLLSIACTARLPRTEVVYKCRGTLVLQFIDVKKAHFWALAQRELYVELSLIHI